MLDRLYVYFPNLAETNRHSDILYTIYTNDTLDVLWNVCDAPPVNVSWWLADSDQEDHSHNSGLMNIRKPLGKYFLRRL